MKCEMCNVNEGRFNTICPGDGGMHRDGRVHIPGENRKVWACETCYDKINKEWLAGKP